MSLLTKRVTILEFVKDRHAIVTFWNEETTLQMSSEDWYDMGHPQEITLTIEPGDLLNE